MESTEASSINTEIKYTIDPEFQVGGIEKLIEVFKKRISTIVQHSLHQFLKSYLEHPDFKKETIPFCPDDLEKASKEPEELEKIVFLLGAGTSKSAGLPMAREIIEYCESALGAELLKNEVAKNRTEINIDNEHEHSFKGMFNGEVNYSFEEVLSVYQKILGAEEAIQLLKEHFFVTEKDFPKKTLITLFNECLAHLAREHLVDFIVTFNFDELLEHSINEDIGPSSYVNIMSQAEFKWADTHGLFDSSIAAYTNPNQRNSLTGSDRAKLWLLKPHGTISHENTLRHLIDHVGKFEEEKEAVLKRIFKNSHIVVVGYSLSASDLHRILITHALSGSIKGLYWVKTSTICEKLGSNLMNTMNKVKPKSFFHIKMDADTFVLKIFKELYSDENLNNEEFRKSGLVPPFRHFIRAYVFQKEKGIKCLFENRYIVEMIIYSLRMNGWFSSRTINKCQQINHLVNCATHSQRECIKNLPDKLSLFFINFPRKNRAERLFFLRKNIRNSFTSEVNGDEQSKILIDLITRCIPSEIDESEQGANSDNSIFEWANLAAQLCRRVQLSQIVSPYPNYGDFTTFNKILIIPNKAVLNALSNWIFSKTENIFIVSETGGFVVRRLKLLEQDAEALIKISRFAGIALGDYKKEFDGIIRELKKKLIIDAIKKLDFRKWEIDKKSGRYRSTLTKTTPEEILSELKGILTIEEYEKLEIAIENVFNNIENHFYLDDVTSSVKSIELFKNYIENFNSQPDKENSNIIFSEIQNARKRFHLDLWEDKENRKVIGVLYNRVDRQARTTFNWILLDLNEPDEYSQFQAFLNYIKGYKNKRRR